MLNVLSHSFVTVDARPICQSWRHTGTEPYNDLAICALTLAILTLAMMSVTK